MSDTVKKPDQWPESHSPKKPEILNVFHQKSQISFQEKIGRLPKTSAGGEPPESCKIEGIHRLYYADRGENYMFVGCVRGALEALGEPEEYDYNFVMALTGDMFTQIYNKDHESDSLSDNFFMPEVAEHVYKVCGYDSVFITKEEIQKYPDDVLNQIKHSILRGAPVISIGVSNIPVASNDGDKIWNGTEPVVNKKVKIPFGSIIGGYEHDNLLINVWIGEALTEENGYALAENALDGSEGIIIAGEKTKKPTINEVYRDVICAVPSYLTLKSMNGYSFGKTAFYEWADHIRNKEILKAQDKWNMHFAPAVILYTNTPRIIDFFKRAIKACPDFEPAKKLLPLYEKQAELNKELDTLQGGFDFDAGRFAEDAFNWAHTDILYRLGDLQDEILKIFQEE